MTIMKEWNSKEWRNQFFEAMKVHSREQVRQLHKQAFEATKRVVMKEKAYTSETGTHVALPSAETMVRGTRFFYRPFDVRRVACAYRTEYEVVCQDCLDAAKVLKDEGMNTVVLNLANANNPGGGVEMGCSAQEEQLFIRTNLMLSLYPFKKRLADAYGLRANRLQYPLEPNFGGIYTPNALVLRGGKDTGYAWLEQPYEMSFIAVAGIDKRGKDSLLNMWEEEQTRNKIRTILRIALYKGHDAIVLGALGCGAFNNDNKQVAHLFHQVLLDDEFSGKFKKVVFAILGKPFPYFHRAFS